MWLFRKLSIKVAEIRGIPLYFDASFTIYLAILVISRIWDADAFGHLLKMIALFSIVTLHELGHSLIAKKLNVTVKQIRLLPIGGVALVEMPEENPRKEFLISAAGPMVNVFLGIFFGFYLYVFGDVLSPFLKSQLKWFSFVNFGVTIFNMIPVYPLDGGRLLRSTLVFLTGNRDMGTRIALWFGRLVLIPLILAAIVGFKRVPSFLFIFAVLFGAGLYESHQISQRRKKEKPPKKPEPGGDVIYPDFREMDDVEPFTVKSPILKRRITVWVQKSKVPENQET